MKILLKKELDAISATGLLIFIIFVCFVWLNFSAPFDRNSHVRTAFVVRNGEGAKQISTELKDKGIIRYSSVFRIYTLLTGNQKKLQAGEYELSPNMPVYEIVNRFSNGQVTKKVTLLEGWDIKDIGNYLEQNKIISAKEFLSAAQANYSKDYSFLLDKPKKAGIEGYLFPDTYNFFPDANAQDIITESLDNFDSKLTPDLRQEIARQKKTVFQVLTMASILEKEVRSLEDKKIVAGIFWKRIDIGMPLQADATANYKAGVEVDGYDTYANYGLPPGPICSPGMDSILAAIYPTKTDYLYYLSEPQGRTIFSKSYADHLVAKRKYLN